MNNEQNLAIYEMLCFMYPRLRGVRVAYCVTVDGPDDPRKDDGAIVYEITLTNGQMKHMERLVQEGPSLKDA